VPNIPSEYLDCVVYIFPDEASARAGENLGGTGFIVGVPMVGYEKVPVHHGYVVTNKHIIQGHPAPAIRLNQLTGHWDVLPTRHEPLQDEWLVHDDGDDVAVCMVGVSEERHRITAITTAYFITEQMVDDEWFGLGDEVFMVSRFSSLAAEETRDVRNTPLLRFGNIAAPGRIRLQRRAEPPQESFLVEARSLSGHSGSPVFAWKDPYRPANRRGETVIGDWHTNIGLLGIDWCHLAPREPLRDNQNPEIKSDEWHVKANSGMMGVVPAWRIVEVLMTDDAKEQQKLEREDWERTHGPPGEAQPDTLPANNALTRAGFYEGLRRIKKQSKELSRSD